MPNLLLTIRLINNLICFLWIISSINLSCYFKLSLSAISRLKKDAWIGHAYKLGDWKLGPMLTLICVRWKWYTFQKFYAYYRQVKMNSSQRDHVGRQHGNSSSATHDAWRDASFAQVQSKWSQCCLRSRVTKVRMNVLTETDLQSHPWFHCGGRFISNVWPFLSTTTTPWLSEACAAGVAIGYHLQPCQWAWSQMFLCGTSNCRCFVDTGPVLFFLVFNDFNLFLLSSSTTVVWLNVIVSSPLGLVLLVGLVSKLPFTTSVTCRHSVKH